MYTKLTHTEHILHRPEMYVGDTTENKQSTWVLEEDKLVYKEMLFKPSVLKLFDEVFTNAVDHYIRTGKVTNISVDIKSDKPYFKVKNNGPGIELYKTEYGVWSPELIFSQLLTSSNYDDSQRDGIGGLNGLGVKLANIFSVSFKVTTVSKGIKYQQQFTNNNTVVVPPVMKKLSSKDPKEYTEVEVLLDPKIIKDADWARYEPLLKQRVYSVCSVIDKPLSVSYSVDGVVSFKEKMSNKSFFQFAKKVEDANFLGSLEGDSFRIVFVTGSQGIQFINGIHTKDFGIHYDQLYKKVQSDLKDSKLKSVGLKVLKSCVSFITSLKVNRPTFSSQSKDKCVGGEIDLDFKLPPVLKKKIVDIITEYTKSKELEKMSKETDGKKKNVISGIDTLDDAKYAGTAKSEKCVLYVTEGLSAKTFAVSGVSSLKSGRQYNGIFPLKGKLLNVKQSSVKKITENEEIKNLKKILGLESSKVYKNTKDLRYGQICILADADADAFHIAGLIINFFHAFWPSLLELGYVKLIRTPLIKAWVKKNVHAFYTEQEFFEFEKTQSKIDKVKYYKGLGSSTSAEAIEVFKNLEKNTRSLVYTKDCSNAIDLAFVKQNNRKEWVQTIELESPGEPNTYCYFINTDLRSFSVYDNVRSIPDIRDGLKVSQRKVLWTMYVKNYVNEIKVAQLGAATAELTDYHHGENSLYSTIVTLAQDFTGSNNIPLLEACGNFGTHLENGDDCASPRYIFTKLSEFCLETFIKQDMAYLDKQFSGTHQQIEPEALSSRFPVVLVNGSKGIGTGFSTDIPSYSKEGIQKEIDFILENGHISNNVLLAYYEGFSGDLVNVVESENGNTFWFETRTEQKSDGLHVYSLPMGKSVSQYKKHLSDKGITFENNCTDKKVHFIIKGEHSTKDLNLRWSKKESNMHLWVENVIKKYTDPREIVYDWLSSRMKFLKKKQAQFVSELQEEITYLEAKARYIEMCINSEINLSKISVIELKELLDSLFKSETITKKLLGILLISMTADNVKKSKEKILKLREDIEFYKKLEGKELYYNL